VPVGTVPIYEALRRAKGNVKNMIFCSFAFLIPL